VEKNGNSDPFIKVGTSDSGIAAKTGVIKDTRNPKV
jgi:Ca2+-dependent lipid-binding protein